MLKKTLIERFDNEKSNCNFVGGHEFFVKGKNICKKCQAIYDKNKRQIDPEKLRISLLIKELKENGMNLCNKCGIIDKIDLFVKDKNICKKCQSIIGKNYRDNDINKIKTCTQCDFIGDSELFVKGRNLCKFCMSLYEKEYRLENKDWIKERDALYRLNNPEKIKQWRKDNPDKVREHKRNTERNRKNKDPIFKLRKECSNMVRKMLKTQSSSKEGNSVNSFFPFTIEELKKHLEALFEPWMTWDNHGIYESKIWDDNNPTTWTWQLDHINPQSDYPYSKMGSENFNIIWALSNLRPYSAKQNILDGVSRIRHIKNI